ncbi:MAG: ArsR/SmtB family transcription factor [Panacagrimonas sp.]
MSRLKSTWPFQALADGNRFRAAHLLVSVGAPLTAGQLSTALNMPPNHLSRHLLIMEVSGLTTTERRGRSHYICLKDRDGANARLFDAILAARDDAAILDADMERFLAAAGGGSEE